MTAPSKEAIAAWDALSSDEQEAIMYMASFAGKWQKGFDAGRKSFADGLVPVMYLESDERARGADLKALIFGEARWMHTVVQHAVQPETSNPVWTLYALPKEPT